MSASNVSIRELRRRALAAGEKNSAVDMAGDAAATTEQNPNHSIRGEVFLTPKKPPSPATGTVPVTYSRRTHRKVGTRPERPKWATIVSVMTKNLLLLIVLIGLVQIVRNWVYDRSGDGVSAEAGSEFERRIADVEGLLKKTTKMLQVQVEVVDAKLENGLSVVRLDLTKKIDEKNVELVNELKKLDGSIQGLETALGELSVGEWIKKEEFEGFINEFRKRKGSDGNSDVDLDKVREVARAIVEKELEKHAADGLGRMDYAVASGGAVVVRHSEPYAVGRGIGWFKRMKDGVHEDAVKMLSPSFGEPGQCFPLKGSLGFVEIRLRTAIIPEAVTMEHVAKSVAFDRSSAPKDCLITGWLQNSTDPTVDTKKPFLLTEFTYDLEKNNAQTFNVVLDTPVVIDTIRFDFTSNHGSPTHTCIYRLRMHGREPDSIPMLAEQS